MATKATIATASTTLISVLRAVLVMAPAILLALFGCVHFEDGRAIDAAIPVPMYMVSHQPLPREAYFDAATELAGAHRRDGIAALQSAEASLRAGRRDRQLVNEIEAGLSQAPANARGWLILSEVAYPSDRNKAVRSFGQALMLGPREYWLVGPEVLDAARMWPDLSPDTQRLVLDRVRLLWEEPSLRSHLPVVASRPEGLALLMKAFSADEIRSVNRWLAQQTRRNELP